MNGLLGFLKHKWVVQFFGLLALALLIWFAGPLIAIAGTAPLESILVRSLVIGFLFVAWLIYRLVRQLLMERKDRQLAGELAGEGAGQSAEREASAEELEKLRAGFEDALRVLQETRAKDQRDKLCLYELPWYAIIGAPGSGKTTALVNSGLHFPLAERFGNKPVKGVSGTRHCDWWFTDEAVLLDTAGRYTTQDSHKAVDAAAWQNFLQLLKKYRPRRPLNGVFVTLSLADLLQQTEEERATHAKELRRRIQELYETLGVRLPIYMLFTKADLVAGFTDFFADLNQEERAEVWGETFPADDPARPQDRLANFESVYDELLQRLNKRTYKRIQDERDVWRRSQILGFPQQMALLKPSMLAFLRGVFADNRYEKPVLLRGVYFTSGTQEGSPIDRLMGILAGTFRLDRQASPIYGGAGKSFFLTRLLKEVVFPEAELAGANPRVERQRKLLHYGSVGGILAATLGVIGLWAIGYGYNQSAIARTEEQIKRYHAADTLPTDSRANFRMLQPKLDALRETRHIWEETGWLAHFGLYQGAKLVDGAGEVYEKLLREYFQPAIVSRLEERLQAKADVLLLKAYLMFGDPAKLEPKIIQAVVKTDWEQMFSTEPEVMSGLMTHLEQWLQLKPRATQLNQNLIASARAALTQTTLEQQCYEGFKAEHGADHAHDFKLAEALQPNGPSAFLAADGGDIASVGVPALYTAWGYGEWFLKKSRGIAQDCMAHNWVLNIPIAASDPREIERLNDKLKALYIHDYQRHWSALLAGIKLRPAGSLAQVVDRLDILSRPDSPLRLLLVAVERNTSLGKVSAAHAELLNQAARKANLNPDDDTRRLVDAARTSAGFDAGTTGDPVRWMESYFEPYNGLVRGGQGQATPLDAPLNKAKELRDYFVHTGGAQPPMGGVSVPEQAKLEFSRLPEPMKGWLLSLTAVGVGQVQSGAKAELNKNLQAAGIAGGGGGSGGGARGSQCQAAFAGRYPFAGGKNDAPLADFSRFFGPNGTMDQFFQAHLKNQVDTSGAAWRQRPADGQPALSQEGLRQFQNAAKIREAFFPMGGPVPQVQFDLKPLALGEGVKTLVFETEGQTLEYSGEANPPAKRVQWPGPVGGSGVRVTFEAADGHKAVNSRDGAWALFRLFDESSLRRGGLDRYELTFTADGLAARFELRALSVSNPLNLPELRGFHCPESL